MHIIFVLRKVHLKKTARVYRSNTLITSRPTLDFYFILIILIRKAQN